MTKKIAIINIHNFRPYSDYYDSDFRLSDYISEWDEVTDEEFKLLMDYSYRTNEFTVIERREKEVINKSVQEQIKYVENKMKEEEIKKKKQE